jgi:hypothetical protein
MVSIDIAIRRPEDVADPVSVASIIPPAKPSAVVGGSTTYATAISGSLRLDVPRAPSHKRVDPGKIHLPDPFPGYLPVHPVTQFTSFFLFVLFD